MTLIADSPTDVFVFFRDFVFARSAIVLGEEKRYLVESRLAPVVRAAGLGGLAELMRAVRRGDPGLETAVVDAMTTNETSWFRDGTPFETLRAVVLPERIAANACQRRLAIWSAACSTGQEPYSVAMLIDSHFHELASWSVDIVGTDLSTKALAHACLGTFSALEVNRGLPASHLLQHFSRDGARFKIAEHLRSRVRFAQANLAHDWPALPPQDIVLLRNVLIYFDAPTRRRILGAVRDQLRPGGYLVLGAAETTRDYVDGFVPVAEARSGIYRLESS